MSIFHETFTKKSRKRRQCDWCDEFIEIGEPYNRYGWRQNDDGGFCTMHLECYLACGELGKDEGGDFQFTPGDFHRGCRCANGDCKCDINTPPQCDSATPDASPPQ